MIPPNPSELSQGNKDELPEVEQMGIMTLEQLHTYNCTNPDRRMLCLFGTVFDVTSSEKSYGKEGACKFWW